MSELWRFFDQKDWDDLHDYLVENELPKYIDYLSELEKFSPFEKDINRVLTSLISYRFGGDIESFKKWLEKKIPALDNMTPREISQQEHGMDWIREFILRTP